MCSPSVFLDFTATGKYVIVTGMRAFVYVTLTCSLLGNGGKWSKIKFTICFVTV
jgi:hypothetical protein